MGFSRCFRRRVAFSILKAFHWNIRGALATLIHNFSFPRSLACSSFRSAAGQLRSRRSRRSGTTACNLRPGKSNGRLHWKSRNAAQQTATSRGRRAGNRLRQGRCNCSNKFLRLESNRSRCVFFGRLIGSTLVSIGFSTFNRRLNH